MGGTKRMSVEEKKKVILNIFHTEQQVYLEKEITTLAEKAGVSRGAIEDTLQQLIDDGAVDKAKIGGTNYMWSFKAKKDRMAQLQHEQTLQQIEKFKIQVNEASTKLNEAKRGREDDESEDGGGEEGGDDSKEGDEKKPAAGSGGCSGSGSRAKKLARLSELGRKKVELQKELERFKENDPASLADLQKELKFVKEAADRWTDNIFECFSYLTKKRQMDKKDAYKMLGISDAFDYPEV
mmetsp:Transcript_55425/g.134592  ORF Transcript_55425/g.134592 Transcript_55425/m.134592 type:complete len:238 (-) Transcript_55425:312-1025(-)